MNYTQLKQFIFSYFHSNLTDIARDIQAKNLPERAKSILINQEVERVKNDLGKILIVEYSHIDRSKLFMLLQYCYSVMSFEYRNVVWPYEYMAFSRRNGELWESFCKAAWDHSLLPNLYRISAPSFHEVRNSFRDRIINHTQGNQYQHHIVNDVDSVFELVGEINMVEDEMFNLNGRNYIIDFKSGFGSNEKGNTLRLIAVGRAYKHWDPNVNLLFLVRQNENNNYLETIRRNNIWEVHCGDAAYQKIDELTNAGICEIRREAIDFRNDLSPKFWSYLVNTNLADYLNW